MSAFGFEKSASSIYVEHSCRLKRSQGEREVWFATEVDYQLCVAGKTQSNTPQRTATLYGTLQHIATYYTTLPNTSTRFNAHARWQGTKGTGLHTPQIRRNTVTHCNAHIRLTDSLQRIVTRCSTLQHTNTLQHNATHTHLSHIHYNAF